MRNTKTSLMLQTLAQLRAQRIQALGAFGAKRERIKPDRTLYTRKSKHSKKGPSEGSFAFVYPRSWRNAIAHLSGPIAQRADKR